MKSGAIRGEQVFLVCHVYNESVEASRKQKLKKSFAVFVLRYNHIRI